MKWFKVLGALGGVATAAHATALQPLEEFLRGARANGPDDAEARALESQSAAEATATLGQALPRLSLQAHYTRNQYQASIPIPAAGGGPPSAVTITPWDQVDGEAILTVPLVDLAKFARIAAARTTAAAATSGAEATDLRVQSTVSQDYYQLIAYAALVDSSQRALQVARVSLRIAEERYEAGAAALLDADRARAEVERNVQQLAAAELQVSLAARALQSATGVSPDLQGQMAFGDDLHEEPPLEQFQTPDDGIPSIATAIEHRVASEQTAAAERLSFVPSLEAALTEQTSNVKGFSGQEAFWQAVVGLTWSFDLTKVANVRAQAAAADAARAEEQRARLTARDDIHRAWMTVETDIARSRSARVEAEVSARASAIALEQYRDGTATQLDLLQAQRDAFNAEASRIQADADLLNSRAQLRIAAGESLLPGAAGRAP